eukprot:4577139-Amphidinium_carterae.1
MDSCPFPVVTKVLLRMSGVLCGHLLWVNVSQKAPWESRGTMVTSVTGKKAATGMGERLKSAEDGKPCMMLCPTPRVETTARVLDISARVAASTFGSEKSGEQGLSSHIAQ